VNRSLWSRLTKGASAQVFSQAVNTIIRLAEVPLFLHFWGAQLYGEWLIIAAIPAYLAMTDLGFAGAAGREMAMRVGAGKREDALVIFQSCALLIACLSVVVAFGVSVLAFVAPLEQWFHMELIGETGARLLLVILSIHVLLNLQNGLLYGVYYCEGQYGLGTLLLALTRLLEFTFLATCIVLGGGPVYAALGFFCGRLLGVFIMRFVLWQRTPWVKYGIRHVSLETTKYLVRPALASTAFPIGNALNIQGMRLIVGVLFGPASVVVFSTLRTLTRVTNQVVNSVNCITEPELSVAFGGKNTHLIRQLYRRSCQISVWGAGLVVIVLALAGDSILRIWTGGRIEMVWSLYSLLLLTVIANALWFTAMRVAYATNRHGSLALAYLFVYGALAFSVAYGGARIYGINAIGAALLLAEIIMTAYVLPFSLKMVDDNWGALLSTVALPPIFLFAVFGRFCCDEPRIWNQISKKK